MSHHSQCGEDRWIEENLKPAPGVFCEVGAFDGVLSSNTYRFEQLGWTGLLVEADPESAAKCLRNRKAQTFCCAVGTPRLAQFRINLADRGLNGLEAHGATVEMPVCVHRLDDLISFRFDHVDLLSIDTEGTELEVWATLGHFRPEIVIMEYQTCDQPPKDQEIISRLARDDYRVVHRTLYNLIFVR